MAAKPKPRLPVLAAFRTAKDVHSDDAAMWSLINTWQRTGLVSVRPIGKRAATVELTEAGHAYVASDRRLSRS